MTGKAYNKTIRWVWVLLLLAAVAVLACVVSLGIGSTHIGAGEIIRLFFAKQRTPEYSIIMDIRLPRTILALAVGGGLSLAGAMLQGMFRNPLVSPYTLGISGGASLGVCLTIAFSLHSLIGVVAFPVSGFIGAMITIVIVYSLGTGKGVPGSQSMLLIGVMISFVSASILMLVMAMSSSEDIHGIVFWIMGSLDEPNNILILIVVISSLAGLVASYFFTVNLNAMALGEEEAIHLGVNVDVTKRWLFLIASILTGICVSVAGIIGFVGLVVPHFVRILTGSSDHRIVFVCSFVAGAAFLVMCDTVTRTIIAPLELPVGVITGIIGGSLFIFALSRNRTRL
ncbi:MAG: iron ABC transporter permease [Kiritimatiellae bacterium]|nr:iron ABC transporter permease [Kiritimatiellia bacterium]